MREISKRHLLLCAQRSTVNRNQEMGDRQQNTQDKYNSVPGSLWKETLMHITAKMNTEGMALTEMFQVRVGRRQTL